MPKKPWIIIVLSLIYILSPPVILLSNSWMNLIPLWGPSGILMRLTPGDWIILSLYLINGTAIFTVRKPAWWIFLASSLMLILYNLWGYRQNPLQPLPAMLVYNVVLFAAAALFFRKEIIAPYFNPRLRWWESDPRYNLDFYCSIDLDTPLELPIRDISRGGCFVSTLRDLPPEKDLRVTLYLQKLSIELKAHAVRKAERPFAGWGLKFYFLNDEESQGLERLLEILREISGQKTPPHERREFERITLPQWIFWKEEEMEHSARVLNLSKTGCCLITSDKDFLNHEQFPLIFPDEADSRPLTGRPVWKDVQEEEIRLGIQFINESRSDQKRIKKLIHFYRAAGSENRNKTQEVDLSILKDSLQNTPFPGLYQGKE